MTPLLQPELPPALNTRWNALVEILRQYGPPLVALSGGVDSSLIAAASYQVWGEKMLAITVDSPVNAPGELETARQVAAAVGFPHRVVFHDDLNSPMFVSNPADRCYHCKLARFEIMKQLALDEGYGCVVEGSNADDTNDYRPGMVAVKELGIRSPLMEAGLNKADIRNLAHAFGLAVWDKPSAPCLATRFPYGSAITPQGLANVAAAETYLQSLGFVTIRVRSLGNEARIEVSDAEIPRLVELRRQVTEKIKSLGFQYVVLDLQGYRMGSMNEVLKQ